MDYTKVTASNSETLKPQKQFENRLLAVLAETTEGACVAAHLTPIELTPGQILHHAEQAIEDVYFPLTVILSCVYNSENGVSLEVGTIGNNGLAGISIALGTNRTPYATEVLIGGAAWRMKAKALQSLLHSDEAETLKKLLLRYAHASLVHSGQMQVCLRMHGLEVRLAGWLRLLYDFNCQAILPLTHYAIGQMLGVRRTVVTLALGHLQTARLVGVTRGRITIS